MYENPLIMVRTLICNILNLENVFFKCHHSYLPIASTVVPNMGCTPYWGGGGGGGVMGERWAGVNLIIKDGN